MIGIGLAFVGLRLVVALAPPNFPRLNEVGLAPEVLVFSIATCGLTVILFGLLPALRASKATPSLGLQDSPRGASTSAARRRTQSVLTVVQLALAVTLLSVAGLLIRSLSQLQSVDPGFRAEGLARVRVSPPKSR